MATLEQAFGSTLRDARRQAGLSQEDLAHQANMHPSAISFLERGLRKPTLHSVFSIAKVLGITASDLVKAVERQNPKVETIPVHKK